MNTRKRALMLGAAAAFALHFGTAWSFTAEQAAAGRAAFGQFCEACHGADLQLSPTAKLAGPEFLTKWQGQSTNDLVAKIYQLLSQIRDTVASLQGQLGKGHAS